MTHLKGPNRRHASIRIFVLCAAFCFLWSSSTFSRFWLCCCFLLFNRLKRLVSVFDRLLSIFPVSITSLNLLFRTTSFFSAFLWNYTLIHVGALRNFPSLIFLLLNYAHFTIAPLLFLIHPLFNLLAFLTIIVWYKFFPLSVNWNWPIPLFSLLHTTLWPFSSLRCFLIDPHRSHRFLILFNHVIWWLYKILIKSLLIFYFSIILYAYACTTH